MALIDGKFEFLKNFLFLIFCRISYFKINSNGKLKGLWIVSHSSTFGMFLYVPNSSPKSDFRGFSVFSFN